MHSGGAVGSADSASKTACSDEPVLLEACCG